MKKQTTLIFILAALMIGVAGYILTTEKKENDENMPMHMGDMHNDTTMNDSHMNHMMGMTVSSERAFLEGMIPHHQEAVDTAKEVIERGGTTPEIMELVEAIVIAQEREIAEMKTWYEAWYGEPYTDNGQYTPMMRELETLSGAAIDRAFLADMIMHHMGAIMMANSVRPYIEHQEITELSQNIITSQAIEIEQMRTILEKLR